MDSPGSIVAWPPGAVTGDDARRSVRPRAVRHMGGPLLPAMLGLESGGSKTVGQQAILDLAGFVLQEGVVKELASPHSAVSLRCQRF